MERNALGLGTGLSLLTAAQLLSSFGIQWYTVAYLGAGPDTDALYAGTTLLQLLSVVVMDPLSFVLVPLLSARPEVERRRLAWPLFLGIGVLAILVTLVLYYAAPYLVRVMVPGFPDATRHLTVDLTRIQLTAFIGVACFTLLSAFYQARSRFIWTAGALLICSLLGWCVLIMALSHGGVRLAAWAQVFVLSGPALLLLKALGAWVPGSFSGAVACLREVGDRMRPLVLSAAFVRTGFVADRFLTSFLGAGSLVMLDLTWRVLAAVVRIFNQGFVTPVVPTLAKLAQARAWEEYVAVCRARLVGVARISALAFVGLSVVAIFGQSIGLWFDGQTGQGGIMGQEVATLRMTFFACAGGLLCGGVNHLLVNAFYAEGETRIPAKVEAAASLVGLVLKVLGFLAGGLLGIAVAISLQYVLAGLLLAKAFYRRMLPRLGECPSGPVESCVSREL